MSDAYADNLHMSALRLVAIPDALNATVLVRCPLCQAEYPLDQALELIPPELIPVKTSDEAIILGSEQPGKKPDQPRADTIRPGSAGAGSIPIPRNIKAPPMNLPSIKPPPLAGAQSCGRIGHGTFFCGRYPTGWRSGGAARLDRGNRGNCRPSGCAFVSFAVWFCGGR